MRFEEIMKTLYYKKEAYFLDIFGKVKHNQTTLYNDRNNCISEKHIEQWLSINDLLNVSAYLNQGWNPNWNNPNESKFILTIENNLVSIKQTSFPCSITYFQTEQAAQTAFDILGDKLLRKILEG
jgi:hypothetical protein